MMTALLGLALVAGCKKDPPPVALARMDVPADPAPKPDDAVEQVKANFARVYFDFDSARLTAAAKAVLDANAAILQRYPEISIEVQGHADERGTTEYNIALGERRAQAVASYLASLGVPRARVTTVSYGEERPAARGTGDSAWAENRRAEFRVVVRTDDAVVEGTVP